MWIHDLKSQWGLLLWLSNQSTSYHVISKMLKVQKLVEATLIMNRTRGGILWHHPPFRINVTIKNGSWPFHSHVHSNWHAAYIICGHLSKFFIVWAAVHSWWHGLPLATVSPLGVPSTGSSLLCPFMDHVHQHQRGRRYRCILRHQSGCSGWGWATPWVIQSTRGAGEWGLVPRGCEDHRTWGIAAINIWSQSVDGEENVGVCCWVPPFNDGVAVLVEVCFDLGRCTCEGNLSDLWKSHKV